MFLIPVTEIDVFDAISSLKKSYSNDYYDLKAEMIKAIAGNSSLSSHYGSDSLSGLP